jgi:hypothetical protein
VRKPGSLKLTRSGQRFTEFFEDMDGLRQWLVDSHPSPSREEIEQGEREQEEAE